MRHYIVTNVAKGTKVYLASSNPGMIRVDGESSACRECGRDISKHGVMNKSCDIVNCDCGACYAVRTEDGVKCEIEWIDCNGTETPDSNDAVGYAVLGSLKFPVCADHARTIGNRRCHHGDKCVHLSSNPSGWTFEPFAKEG